MAEFWSQRLRAEEGMYDCPWCIRQLKPRVSGPTAKNPNRAFVSCSTEHDGCGLFCFLDALPNEKFNPNASAAPVANGGGVKRARVAASPGTNIVGPVTHTPGATDARVADLAAEVAQLRKQLADLGAVVAQLKHDFEQ